MQLHIFELDPAGMDRHQPRLAEILASSVADGASIGFMLPITVDEALRYWREQVRPELVSGGRRLLVAEWEGLVVGTVQLIMDMPRNQPHRCEVAKMMVHPTCRRRGFARALMLETLRIARLAGRQLVTLDTRQGDAAEQLYASVGFQVAGVIPDFAWDTEGQALHATTYMYCKLQPTPTPTPA